MLNDYHSHIVINLPNKDVTTDQVLSTLVTYVTTWIFIKIYDKNNKNCPNVRRTKLYVTIFLFCIKIVSLRQFRHSSVHVIANCNPLTNTKGQKNSLHIALRQQTEIPHPLLTSSSSKTTTIVREQRYTRIKYTCKAVHVQKTKIIW